jgi:hypothetical protein
LVGAGFVAFAVVTFVSAAPKQELGLYASGENDNARAITIEVCERPSKKPVDSDNAIEDDKQSGLEAVSFVP